MLRQSPEEQQMEDKTKNFWKEVSKAILAFFGALIGAIFGGQ